MKITRHYNRRIFQEYLFNYAFIYNDAGPYLTIQFNYLDKRIPCEKEYEL